jgi:hypothetical protein
LVVLSVFFLLDEIYVHQALHEGMVETTLQELAEVYDPFVTFAFSMGSTKKKLG